MTETFTAEDISNALLVYWILFCVGLTAAFALGIWLGSLL